MFGAIGTALSIAGVVTASTTSWIAIVVALVAMFLLWVYEDQISVFARSNIKSIKVRRAIDQKIVRLGFKLLTGFVIITSAVVIVNISILRPNVIVGYTDQPPFRFARYVAAISRSPNPPGGYCPLVEIQGDIINATTEEMLVYWGTPIRIWSTTPSSDYSESAQIYNISNSYSRSSILPGSGLHVTISGTMNPSQCKDFKADDLQRLRRGRLNATTGVILSKTDGKDARVQSVQFLDLPIALGD